MDISPGAEIPEEWTACFFEGFESENDTDWEFYYEEG